MTNHYNESTEVQTSPMLVSGAQLVACGIAICMLVPLNATNSIIMTDVTTTGNDGENFPRFLGCLLLNSLSGGTKCLQRHTTFHLEPVHICPTTSKRSALGLHCVLRRNIKQLVPSLNCIRYVLQQAKCTKWKGGKSTATSPIFLE